VNLTKLFTNQFLNIFWLCVLNDDIARLTVSVVGGSPFQLAVVLVNNYSGIVVSLLIRVRFARDMHGFDNDGSFQPWLKLGFIVILSIADDATKLPPKTPSHANGITICDSTESIYRFKQIYKFTYWQVKYKISHAFLYARYLTFVFIIFWWYG
jgi:hypothetical protein